jgi:hypothetical protein
VRSHRALENSWPPTLSCRWRSWDATVSATSWPTVLTPLCVSASRSPRRSSHGGSLRQGSNATLRSLLIVGHTDSTGTEEYNMGLSKKRAFAVAQALQAAGVNGKYIGIIPMGKEQPFATNSTPQGRALNRRVEFFISDIPEATEKAVQLIRFNPCFRSDQNSGGTTPTPGCDNTPKRIPIYSPYSDTKPRGSINLIAKPIERPRLPDRIFERPRLRDLDYPNQNK